MKAEPVSKTEAKWTGREREKERKSCESPKQVLG